MNAPQIIVSDWEGRHNKSDYVSRLEKAQLYKDQSTICVIPTRGTIHARVVQNWLGMMTPMNQKFMRMMIIGMEVGAAYSKAVDDILGHPDLKNWRFVLSLEEDNTVPPDGLLKLIEDIGDYDAIGGLYWTKGEGGLPMMYGSPKVTPLSFIPQIPVPGTVTECCGLGQGFTLFKLDSLRKMKEKLNCPLFQTKQVYEPGKGVQCYTQDLWHFQQGREMGFRYACSSKVLVGHYDQQNDVIW